MLAFALSILLSAFLLFIVQPLMAKKLLPWFGGSPSVWLAIVLFFQTILLIGYLYAFTLTKIRSLSKQVIIHFILMILSLVFIPIAPVEIPFLFSHWPPLNIMLILGAALLLPGILIGASSPLLQHWYCQCYQTDFPYRYYAISNFGSLLGLLSFPFLIEPFLGTSFQILLWSVFYLIYLISLSCCSVLVLKLGKICENLSTRQIVTKSSLLSWIVLTFLSSALLLSTTQITLQNVAGFPLLWVIPLSLYLISFIITFSYPKVYFRTVWVGIFTISSAIVLYYPSHHTLALKTQIALIATLLLSGCMICHGELILLKPNKAHLTLYYLAIAFGGVFGSLFINLIAPLIFDQWWDFYATLIGILICAGFFGLAFIKNMSRIANALYKGAWLTGTVGIASLLYFHLNSINKDVILNHRNFFGAFTVSEHFPENSEYHYRSLTNGNILHGKQYLNPAKRNNPTSYYSPKSGIGLAIDFQRLYASNPSSNLAIGVIGLGAGTIAALAKPGDVLHFYEIDPDIEKIARHYFYYLHDVKAMLSIFINDGRLALENKLRTMGSSNYDVLAIDAFNGDAIPVHLLTLEAIQTYLAHLSPNGILAFHVSSRYVDLYPPLQAIATKLQLYAFTTLNDEDLKEGIFSSRWVLLTKHGDLGAYLYPQQVLLFPQERMDQVWTDDFNNLLSIIKW